MNKTVRLGDICTIKSAKRIFESEYVEEGVPFIRGMEISDGSIGKPDTKYECYISKERYNEIKALYGVPQQGDLLITAVGTIGNLYYVDTHEQFYYKDGNVIQFTNFASGVNSKYLFYYMKSPYFLKQLECSLIGAVQKALTMVMLAEIEVILPDIQTQRNLSDILSLLDCKVQNNKNTAQELESMAKTLYDYWFVQFDFPDENGRPYRTSGGEMVWNDQLKREIPKGWSIGKIKQLGSIVSGGTPSTKHEEYYCDCGFAWITPNDLSGNEEKMFIGHGERDVTQAGIDNSSATLMPKGSVLLSTRAPIGYLLLYLCFAISIL